MPKPYDHHVKAAQGQARPTSFQVPDVSKRVPSGDFADVEVNGRVRRVPYGQQSQMVRDVQEQARRAEPAYPASIMNRFPVAYTAAPSRMTTSDGRLFTGGGVAGAETSPDQWGQFNPLERANLRERHGGDFYQGLEQIYGADVNDPGNRRQFRMEYTPWGTPKITKDPIPQGPPIMGEPGWQEYDHAQRMAEINGQLRSPSTLGKNLEFLLGQGNLDLGQERLRQMDPALLGQLALEYWGPQGLNPAVRKQLEEDIRAAEQAGDSDRVQVLTNRLRQPVVVSGDTSTIDTPYGRMTRSELNAFQRQQAFNQSRQSESSLKRTLRNWGSNFLNMSGVSNILPGGPLEVDPYHMDPEAWWGAALAQPALFFGPGATGRGLVGAGQGAWNMGSAVGRLAAGGGSMRQIPGVVTNEILAGMRAANPQIANVATVARKPWLEGLSAVPQNPVLGQIAGSVDSGLSSLYPTLNFSRIQNQPISDLGSLLSGVSRAGVEGIGRFTGTHMFTHGLGQGLQDVQAAAAANPTLSDADRTRLTIQAMLRNASFVPPSLAAVNTLAALRADPRAMSEPTRIANQGGVTVEGLDTPVYFDQAALGRVGDLYTGPFQKAMNTVNSVFSPFSGPEFAGPREAAALEQYRQQGAESRLRLGQELSDKFDQDPRALAAGLMSAGPESLRSIRQTVLGIPGLAQHLSQDPQIARILGLGAQAQGPYQSYSRVN